MALKKKSNFKCEFCDKICLTSRVLKKHFTRHPTTKMRLEPLILKCFFEKSIYKLAQDEY